MFFTHTFQNWGLPYGWAWTLSNVIVIFVFEFALMISVAMFILADRKIWAAVHLRKGPNVVGPFGLLQTFADAFKFLLKELIIPAGANKVIFILAPMVTAILAFAGWAVVPFDDGWVVANINVGVLYLFAVSSLGVYGIIMGGWASNSKYPFLGSLRSAAQMVSYEVSIGFVIITVLLFAGSRTSRNTPCAAGCCGPKLIVVVSPASAIRFCLFVSRQNERRAFPRTDEIEIAEFLNQLHRPVHHALQLFVIMDFDIAGQREILA